MSTLATPKPLKTVGSYWPHATTIFDYIRRAMPFNQPGMLTDDQVYAVTAYILQLNGIIKEGETMNLEIDPLSHPAWTGGGPRTPSTSRPSASAGCR